MSHLRRLLSRRRRPPQRHRQPLGGAQEVALPSSGPELTRGRALGLELPGRLVGGGARDERAPGPAGGAALRVFRPAQAKITQRLAVARLQIGSARFSGADNRPVDGHQLRQLLLPQVQSRGDPQKPTGQLLEHAPVHQTQAGLLVARHQVQLPLEGVQSAEPERIDTQQQGRGAGLFGQTEQVAREHASPRVA